MSSVVIVDYGMGNLHSVAKAVQHACSDARVVVSDQSSAVDAAERVILPGVGALADCTAALVERGLDEAVRHCVATRPFLGICLGMQALLDFSEENGGTDAFGIVPGKVRRFEEGLVDPVGGRALKIPHMGWNQVAQVRPHPLWDGIPDQSRFYFVHSYYVCPEAASVVTGETVYGKAFAAAIARDNIFAVQFHPEKSQRHGLRMLANFMSWDGSV